MEAYLDKALRDHFVCGILSEAINTKETATSREAHFCHNHTGITEQGKGRKECSGVEGKREDKRQSEENKLKTKASVKDTEWLRSPG